MDSEALVNGTGSNLDNATVIHFPVSGLWICAFFFTYQSFPPILEYAIDVPFQKNFKEMTRSFPNTWMAIPEIYEK